MLDTEDSTVVQDTENDWDTIDFISIDDVDDYIIDGYSTDENSIQSTLASDFEFIEHPGIIPLDYDSPYDADTTVIPLIIGCSGGGGHNAASEAFAQFLKQNRHNKLPIYLPGKSRHSAVGISILVASYAGFFPAVTKTMKAVGLPIVPNHTKLSKAKMQLQTEKCALYIDMLLHVYKTGYDNAAIWNTLQREDQKEELLKLVTWQSQNDLVFYADVYRYFLKLLLKTHLQGTPYTEVISTQALGLPALCDAVREYNRRCKATLVIHQYMTDLPTSGAIHFFGILSKLSPTQQNQMKLYAVGMNEPILQVFFKQGIYFQNVYTVNPKKNPMLRAGFHNPDNDNSARFDIEVSLSLTAGTTLPPIKANERIAAIMLGSQAGTDTTSYISSLIHNGIDKVFVFGGTNPDIKSKIETYLSSFLDKIILLPPQGDDFIASLMTRCHILIIRAGGLSVMEQMAMNHHKDQIILIHHADSDSEILESGIPWEDANADVLINVLQAIRIAKTSPSLAYEKIQLFQSEMGYYQEEERDWKLVR